MRDWLQVVAKHVSFDECVTAAVVTLLMGLPLASFDCSKCGATHRDTDKFVQKLHMHHICSVCNHRWIKQPAVVGNPLAALGCSLEGCVLYMCRVLVTVGALHVVAGHVSFDECVAAAVETLSMGLPLASFGCSKCGATHLDADKFVRKLHTCHIYAVYNHYWIK